MWGDSWCWQWRQSCSAPAGQCWSRTTALQTSLHTRRSRARVPVASQRPKAPGRDSSLSSDFRPLNHAESRRPESGRPRLCRAGSLVRRRPLALRRRPSALAARRRRAALIRLPRSLLSSFRTSGSPSLPSSFLSLSLSLERGRERERERAREREGEREREREFTRKLAMPFFEW